MYTLWLCGIPTLVVQKLEHVEEINNTAHNHSANIAHIITSSDGIIMGEVDDHRWMSLRKVKHLKFLFGHTGHICNLSVSLKSRFVVYYTTVYATKW